MMSDMGKIERVEERGFKQDVKVVMNVISLTSKLS